jgi:hypothetical protein
MIEEKNSSSIPPELSNFFLKDIINKAMQFTKEEVIFVASLVMTANEFNRPTILYYDQPLLSSMNNVLTLLKSKGYDTENLFYSHQALPPVNKTANKEEKKLFSPDTEVWIAGCHKKQIKYKAVISAYEQNGVRNFYSYLGDIPPESEDSDVKERKDRLDLRKRDVIKLIQAKKGRNSNVVTHLDVIATDEYKKAERVVNDLLNEYPDFENEIKRNSYDHLLSVKAKREAAAATLETKREAITEPSKPMPMFLSEYSQNLDLANLGIDSSTLLNLPPAWIAGFLQYVRIEVLSAQLAGQKKLDETIAHSTHVGLFTISMVFNFKGGGLKQPQPDGCAVGSGAAPLAALAAASSKAPKAKG